MAENLEAFRSRTSFITRTLPEGGGFSTNAKLALKVDEAGRLLPFFGDTVIFDLPEEDKAWLGDLQRGLYERCGDLLAEPLNPASFHITLHDLDSCAPAEDMVHLAPRNRKLSLGLLGELPEDWAVNVRSTLVFNMVNTSLVLGFEPVSDADCLALTDLYDRFQLVVKHYEFMTPHVTLAYYRPIQGGDDVLSRLRGAVEEVNGELSPRVIRLCHPRYATFTDMNRYQWG